MRYAFAECVLDTQLYTLHRSGTDIRLRPKVFHVLEYLLTHRDHVVSKGELCISVWPAQFISDATLEGCIKAARQAIGDSGRTQRLIQSRRGYGYRFVGAVEERAVPSPDQEGAASAAPPAAAVQERAPGQSAPGLLLRPPEAGVAEVALGWSTSAPLTETSQRLPARRVSAGERKLVTLLSCILIPDMRGTAPLDLEVLHRQMQALYACAQHEVHQYGGTIQQVAGDRLWAVFGAPLSQEEHAQRAVLAALGLHQRFTESQAVEGDPAHAPMGVCIGLHTTPMIVGMLGHPAAPAPVIIGETSRVLDALQTQRAPGTVVCSDTTAYWVGGMVRLAALSPVSVQGQSTPLNAYTVLGVRPRRRPGAWREPQRLGPFVGRTRELATLHTMLTQVSAGRGQIVGIMGAPGIGKSRLLVEFQRRLRGRRLTYLRGRCLSYGQATPYLPVLDLLRHAWGITPADRSQGIAIKVQRGLQEVGLLSDEAADLLLAFLGDEGTREPLVALPPEVRKARTFAILLQLCMHGSQQRPLVLELEDLHWSDATSEEWLVALSACLGMLPILVLGTYRPGYRQPWLEKSYATQLALAPLPLRLRRQRAPSLTGALPCGPASSWCGRAYPTRCGHRS